MTRGGGGAGGGVGDSWCHVAVERVAVVDPNGAGDAFLAAFAAAHLCGADLDAALARGTTVAAAVGSTGLGPRPRWAAAGCDPVPVTVLR